MKLSSLVGVDIGSEVVKAATVRRRRDRFLVTGLSMAVVNQPDAKSPDPAQNTAMAVWRCLHTIKSRPGGVVCAASGPEVSVRTFDFPPLPAKELPSAVQLEAAQVCPFDLDQSTVAYQVLSNGSPGKGAGKAKDAMPPRTVGVLAAAKNERIVELQRYCAAAGARCLLVDVDGLAALNCAEACKLTEPGKTILVLNVGSTYTNVAILSGDGRPFVRDVPYAGSAIVDAACGHGGVVRTAVIEALSQPQDAPSQKVQAALVKACGKLAEQAQETVRYYGAQQPNTQVDRVYVCGGLAQATSVTEALQARFGDRISVLDPLASMPTTRSVRKSGAAKWGPAFAVAIGLAMRSLRDVHN